MSWCDYFNAVTVETVKSWSFSVIFHIVWFSLRSPHWSHQTSVWSSGMPLSGVQVQRFCTGARKRQTRVPTALQTISVLTHALTANSFPQCKIGRLVLNLFQTRDTITVLYHAVPQLWRNSSLAFTNISWYVKAVNVQSDNFEQFSFGSLTFACNAFWFNKTYSTTALHTLNFILRAKEFYLLYYTVPFTLKQLRPWEACSPNDPWSFATTHSFMHF